MAEKKKNKDAKKAQVEEPKKGKKTLTEEAKKAKREARKEALKNRPEGQRPNSKQVDIIETGNGKVETFAYSLRKTGTLVTSVLYDAKGNPISVSNTFVPGTKAKVKKGHGNIVPGVAGEGKKKKGQAEDEEEDED